jgi:hypothetical protein
LRLLPPVGSSEIIYTSNPGDTGQSSPPSPLRRAGSLLPLELFDQWCRSYVAFVLTLGYGSRLVFADGPGFDEPYGQTWALDGEPSSSVEECLAEVLPNWARHSGASQVGVTVPLGDADDPAVLLVVADEAGIRAAKAPAALADEAIFVGDWIELAPPSNLPVDKWLTLC